MESIILPFNGYNYRRMRHNSYRIIVLFAIFGLISLPVYISARADIQRAEQALRQDHPLEASDKLQHAAMLLFWRDDLRERAGRAAFSGGDFPAAARLLGQVENLSTDGWADLGSAYYQLDRYEDSAEALQRGLAMHGPNARLYRGLVLTSNASGDLQGEITALQDYLRLDDTDAAIHHRLGLLLSVVDSENAMPVLMHSAKLDGAYDPAVQTMRTAINLAMVQPDKSDRMVAIGRGLGLVQEWKLAYRAFQQAVDENGENADAWAWLGEAEQHLGMDGGGHLANAVRLKPFSANVRALFGLYWSRKDEAQKSLAQFQWAAALEPKNPAFIASLADAYVFAGELPNALAANVRTTELAPTEVIYWRRLALFTAQYGYQIDETGIPAAQQVLKLVPDDPASYDLLGWVYLAASHDELAKDTLLAAVRLDPEYTPALLHLGMAYIQLEQMEDARLHLLQAQRLDPEGVNGQQAAQLLKVYFP